MFFFFLNSGHTPEFLPKGKKKKKKILCISPPVPGEMPILECLDSLIYEKFVMFLKILGFLNNFLIF